VPVPSTIAGGATADLAGFTSDEGHAFPANHPFWLVHFGNEPGTWEVVEVDGKPVWVPALTPWILKEGCNGVRTLGAGDPKSLRAAVAETLIKERGGVVLDLVGDVPSDCLPAGVAPGGALRVWSTRSGGKHYALVWDQPRPALGNGEFVPKHHADEYNRWRASLVASGQIKPPNEAMLDATRASTAIRASGIKSRASKQADAGTRAALVAEADAMVSAVDVAAIPTDAPKAKRRAAEVTA
jgi:hypothetical protein